jgi:hypothetical protein
MNDKTSKDATPSKGSKSKDKSLKMSSKNVLEPAPTPEAGRHKATSSAELLRAMSGDEESVLDTAAVGKGVMKASSDKLVSLTAQSPDKAMIEDNASLAELHNDEEGLSLIRLSLANYMTPVPIYQYLENVFSKESKRAEKLKQIFLALGVESKAAYAQYLHKNKTNQMVDSALIPPLGPSLRQWIDDVNNI